jgi:monofunctional biosynthetic peptidoglycan transglycosylase
MAFSLKPSRPGSQSGMAYRFGWWLGRLIIWFVVGSFALTVLFKYVPPPVTLTMLLDGNGFTKDWTGLSRIDRNMVAAVIAGEDSQVLRTRRLRPRRDRAGDGAQRSAEASCAAVRRSASRPPRTCSCGRAAAGPLSAQGLEAWFTLLIENIWGKRRIMEVYLNVAETGIGTYGVEAAAQRYYKHSAAQADPGGGGPDRRRPAQSQEALGHQRQGLHPPPRQHHREAQRRGEATAGWIAASTIEALASFPLRRSTAPDRSPARTDHIGWPEAREQAGAVLPQCC